MTTEWSLLVDNQTGQACDKGVPGSDQAIGTEHSKSKMVIDTCSLVFFFQLKWEDTDTSEPGFHVKWTPKKKTLQWSRDRLVLAPWGLPSGLSRFLRRSLEGHWVTSAFGQENEPCWSSWVVCQVHELGTPRSQFFEGQIASFNPLHSSGNACWNLWKDWKTQRKWMTVATCCNILFAESHCLVGLELGPIFIVPKQAWNPTCGNYNLFRSDSGSGVCPRMPQVLLCHQVHKYTVYCIVYWISQVQNSVN